LKPIKGPRSIRSIEPSVASGVLAHTRAVSNGSLPHSGGSVYLRRHPGARCSLLRATSTSRILPQTNAVAALAKSIEKIDGQSFSALDFRLRRNANLSMIALKSSESRHETLHYGTRRITDVFLPNRFRRKILGIPQTNFQSVGPHSASSWKIQILRLSRGSVSTLQRMEGSWRFPTNGASPRQATLAPLQKEYKSGQNFD
jgi:hypothetical protein